MEVRYFVICSLLVVEVGHASVFISCILIYHIDSSLTVCISSRMQYKHLLIPKIAPGCRVCSYYVLHQC